MTGNSTFEADGLRFDVQVSGPGMPTLGFADAFAKAAPNGAAIQGTTVVVGSIVQVSFAPWSLPPERYVVQVRAGAGPTQTGARTVYEGVFVVKDSAVPQS